MRKYLLLLLLSGFYLWALPHLCAFNMNSPEAVFTPEISAFHRRLLVFDKLRGDEKEMVTTFFDHRMVLLKVVPSADKPPIETAFYSSSEEIRVLALYQAFRFPPEDDKTIILNVIKLFEDRYTRYFAVKYLQDRYSLSLKDLEKTIYKRQVFRDYQGRENKKEVYQPAASLEKIFKDVDYEAHTQNTPILNQRLSISANGLYIYRLLSLINKRTLVTFFYRVPLDGFVNVSLSNERLSVVLTKILHPLGFDWRYFGPYQVEIIRLKK